MDAQWENGKGLVRVRLRRKVSVAVLAIDDFTGKPVNSASLKVTAAQLLDRPVRKPDGYYLFLDCQEPVLDITASDWTYHPSTIRVEPAALPRLRPVVKLRLTPNRNYAIPTHTTCVEGTAPAGARIRVLCSNDPRPLRLLYDYQRKGDQEGRLIRIYDPTESDLEGRMLALYRKGETQPEFFRVSGLAEEEEGGCLLSEALSGDCKKAGATVLPVFTASADKQGLWFLPLPTLAVKEYQCQVLWQAPGESEWHELTQTLEPGGVTRLEL